jgi:hypothetical protein
VSAKNADVRIMSASNPQLLGLDTTDICIDDSSVVSSSGTTTTTTTTTTTAAAQWAAVSTS